MTRISESEEALFQATLQYMNNKITNKLIISLGSGSLILNFVDFLLLNFNKKKISCFLTSNYKIADKLSHYGFKIKNLNDVDRIHYHIDTAQEFNSYKELVKYDSYCFTEEKIFASMAGCFICMVDKVNITKQITSKKFSLEVLPFAKSFIAREIVELGGDPVLLENIKTKSNNEIIDVYNFSFGIPSQIEKTFDAITGVVASSIFSLIKADIVFTTQYSNINNITKLITI